MAGSKIRSKRGRLALITAMMITLWLTVNVSAFFWPGDITHAAAVSMATLCIHVSIIARGRFGMISGLALGLLVTTAQMMIVVFVLPGPTG